MCVTKSPNADKLEINELFAAIKAATNKPVVIMGDLNYPSVNWETLDTDTLDEDYLDLVNDCNLIQHVKHSNMRLECTGFVFFSSEDGMVENLHVKEHLGNSDHNIITWNISLDSTRRNVSTSVHNYNKADYYIINECFFNIDWKEMFSNIDINTMWNKFITIVEEVIDKMVPINISKERNYPKWMTRRAKLDRKLKSTMWARFRLSKEYTG